MNRLACFSLILIISLLGSSKAFSAAIASKAESKLTLFVGIPQNRAPFVYTNEIQVVDGVLIKLTKTLCNQLNYDCIFMPGSFYPTLEKLQGGALQALIVLDDVILPEVDEVRLSDPLCKVNPVFIQMEEGNSEKKQPSDFEGKKLGFLSNTTMHLDLLDNYSEFASLHPYELLESAAFDLAFGRIDSLYVSEAFYLERIAEKNLMPQLFPDKKFEVAYMKEPTDFPTSMRLAIPASDTTLLNRFNKAITEQKMGAGCAGLARIKKNNLSLIGINDPR
jgi:ABC-type amino acid transport substrate-binding protein